MIRGEEEKHYRRRGRNQYEGRQGEETGEEGRKREKMR